VKCCLMSIHSRVLPFIAPRRDPGYMYRCQSRGRQKHGALTYSRPPYRRGLEPCHPGSSMMITRAPVSCSARRLGLVHRSHACTIRRQIRWSGCGVVSRGPTRPQEGTLSGRGSDAVQCPGIRSADLGCLERVLIGCSVPVSRILTRPGSFGGEGYKKNDRTGACSLSRFP